MRIWIDDRTTEQLIDMLSLLSHYLRKDDAAAHSIADHVEVIADDLKARFAAIKEDEDEGEDQ